MEGKSIQFVGSWSFTKNPAPKPLDELKVQFVIKNGDKDKGTFVKNEAGGVNSTLVLPNPYDATQLAKQAPKIEAREGYRFKGWDKAFSGTLTADTVYYTVFVTDTKPEEPKDPESPVTPEKPTWPQPPARPWASGI